MQISDRLLCTVATTMEASVLQEIMAKPISSDSPAGNIIASRTGSFDLMLTGVGIAATTHHLTKALYTGNYSMVLNFGIAGSYQPSIPIGTVVQITRDRFADFGAEIEYGLIPAEKLPFTQADVFPYTEGWLEPNPVTPALPITLPKCTGITSDTVHTTPESILRLNSLFQPDIATMEGAALFFVCMLMDLPCLQVRSVSNMVGPRIPENWNLELALKNLKNTLLPYLRNL